jgi:hypothetical protein
MFLLWWSVSRFSRTRRGGRELGCYLAAMDLFIALRKDLGEDAEVLSNATLQDYAEKSEFGMHFKDNTLLISIARGSEYNGEKKYVEIPDGV